jgi:exosortase
VPTNARHEFRTVRQWQGAVAGTALLVLFAFLPGVLDLAVTWGTKADYSHGILLVAFAGYLLWKRWERVEPSITWPSLAGLPLFGLAVILHYFAYTNYAQITVRSLAVWCGLLGVVFVYFGSWQAWRWCWPAFAVVLLALPLPDRVVHEIAWQLQKIALSSSTFLFQMLGLPAYQPRGQMMIQIGSTQLEILRACAGLSMLMTFVSIAVAYALTTPQRPVADRLVLVASSLPIAVLCNVGRIVVTGLVYHAGWKSLGDLVIHDFAGWLMMPIALGLFWLEIRLIDWILVPRDTASLDEVAKVGIKRAAIKAAEVAGYVPPREAAIARDADRLSSEEQS